MGILESISNAITSGIKTVVSAVTGGSSSQKGPTSTPNNGSAMGNLSATLNSAKTGTSNSAKTSTSNSAKTSTSYSASTVSSISSSSARSSLKANSNTSGIVSKPVIDTRRRVSIWSGYDVYDWLNDNNTPHPAQAAQTTQTAQTAQTAQTTQTAPAARTYLKSNDLAEAKTKAKKVMENAYNKEKTRQDSFDIAARAMEVN